MNEHRPDPPGTRRRAAATLLAAVLLAATALAACGSDEEQPAAVSEQTSEAGSTESGDPAVDSAADNGEGEAGEGARTGPEPLTAAVLTDIVSRFFTAADPALACDELATERLVRSAYGDRSGCAAAQVPAAAADQVRFGEIDISKTAATAKATPQGGASDGVELTVGLVPVDGEWRIDSLDADVPVGP